MQLHRDPCSEGTCAWFNAVVIILKFLINVFLNLSFVIEVQWDNNVYALGEAIHIICVYSYFLLLHSHLAVPRNNEYKIPGNPLEIPLETAGNQ